MSVLFRGRRKRESLGGGGCGRLGAGGRGSGGDRTIEKQRRRRRRKKKRHAPHEPGDVADLQEGGHLRLGLVHAAQPVEAVVGHVDARLVGLDRAKGEVFGGHADLLSPGQFFFGSFFSWFFGVFGGFLVGFSSEFSGGKGVGKTRVERAKGVSKGCVACCRRCCCFRVDPPEGSVGTVWCSARGVARPPSLARSRRRCRRTFVSTLNSVDLPTLGSPTMPICWLCVAVVAIVRVSEQRWGRGEPPLRLASPHLQVGLEPAQDRALLRPVVLLLGRHVVPVTSTAARCAPAAFALGAERRRKGRLAGVWSLVARWSLVCLFATRRGC